MSLTLAASFMPSYAALPAYLTPSKVSISPRFPRPGGTTNGQTIGINGTSTTYTPIRSALEAQAWGVDVALWSYTTDAVTNGYASTAEFVGEFTAAGIPIQGTTNTRAVNVSTGPFMQDAAGNDWSAGSNPTRPLVGGLAQSPSLVRYQTTIDYMPAADVTNTQTPKLAAIASQMASGTFGLHMDDPRGPMVFAGWRGIRSEYDIVGAASDFSATARAGFTTWLSANTTSGQRTAVGLPASLSGFDILTWLTTNKSSVMFTPGQDNPTAVDAYRFRTQLSTDESLRTIILNWMGRFLREDHYVYVQQVRTQLAGAPLSLNFFSATPSEFMSGVGRQSPQLWDFAVAETLPPYWSDLSAYTVGSASFFDARAVQQAEQMLNAAMCDACGLRAWFENKPTAMNQAPARVLKQILRQSMLDNVRAGHGIVVPADVYMDNLDTRDQGTSVSGYRFWGSVADYGDIGAFVKAQAALIDGYGKCATVWLAVHSDSFPNYIGGSRTTTYVPIMQRLAELWKRDVGYHLLIVGDADGVLPASPARSVETTAPLIIRLQNDADYSSQLGRLSGPRCRRWTTSAADEAMGHSPVRSTNPYVRASARYNPTARRVSVHLHNYAINADGTPSPQTTTLLWNWGGAGAASVVRLGESAGAVDLSSGSAQIALTEYAIVNFAVA